MTKHLVRNQVRTDQHMYGCGEGIDRLIVTLALLQYRFIVGIVILCMCTRSMSSSWHHVATCLLNYDLKTHRGKEYTSSYVIELSIYVHHRFS